MLAEATAAVRTLSTAEARDLLGREDVLFVDLRDPRELAREGRIPGAFHCPRGMLEFWVDPASPYAKPQFQAGQDLRFLLRRRPALGVSAHLAQRMGLAPVAHIGGGFAEWKKAGAPDRGAGRSPQNEVLSMSLTLFIGNKAYSSWSLRSWLLLRALEIPFEERVTSSTSKARAKKC